MMPTPFLKTLFIGSRPLEKGWLLIQQAKQTQYSMLAKNCIPENSKHPSDGHPSTPHQPRITTT
jgi:hypothetical protein